MAIPSRFLGELRDKLILSEIVSSRIKLSRAGREFKGCCPFHHEKTPSFYINDDKQFYHCFGCGAHGDVIGFIMEHDNLSFIDSVEMLALQAGMQVPKQTAHEVEKAKKENCLYALMDDTTKFFQATLNSSSYKEAYQYLLDRDIKEPLINFFRLGFAPSDNQALRKHLLKIGYTDQQMLDAGVLRESNKGSAPYAFFKDRVIFPVADRRGRVVAFGGRILPEHLQPHSRGNYSPPKYINSSDSVLFHKGRMLFGESQARQAVSDGQPLLLVEGYMDVIACYNAGWHGTVSPLGTALTEDQILCLWNMIPTLEKTPTLCFDGDNAGRRAAQRAAERVLPLLKPNQSVRFAFLPEGQDPDSLMRALGRAAFDKVIEAAIPLAEFIWLNHIQGKKLNTPEERAGLEKSLHDEVIKIADRSVQTYYKQYFRDKLRQIFSRRSYKIHRNANANQAYYKLGRPDFAKTRLQQLILLASAINHPEIFGRIEEDLSRFKIQDHRLDSLRQEIITVLGNDSTLDFKGLNSHLNSAGFEMELKMVLSDAVRTHAAFISADCDTEKVLIGWQELMSMLQSKMMKRELMEAGKALAENFSEENERKVMALQDVNKAMDS